MPKHSSHKHKRSRRAKKEIEARRLYDTNHEDSYHLAEGLGDPSPWVPVPDRVRTIKPARDWSSSESEHFDESSEDSHHGNSVSYGSSSESYSSGSSKSSHSESDSGSYSEASSSSEEEEKHSKHSKKETGMSTNDTHSVTKSFTGKSFEEKATSELKKVKPQHDDDNEYDAEQEWEGGVPPPPMAPPPPPQMMSSGHRGWWGWPMRRHHHRHHKRHHDDQMQTRGMAKKEKHHHYSSKNSSSSCAKKNPPMPTSTNKKRKAHPESKDKTSKKVKPEATNAGSQAAKNVSSQGGKNGFVSDNNAWETTTYNVQFKGTPDSLDKMATRDPENRLNLNLHNKCITVQGTTSDTMAQRITQRINNGADDDFVNGSEREDNNNLEQIYSLGRKMKGMHLNKNVSSQGGKRNVPSSNMGSTDNLSSERDLVRRVTITGGNNPFPHDVEFHFPDLIVPGHHMPGQEAGKKGLVVTLTAGEQIQSAREIANAKITNDTTKYHKSYPSYSTLNDLKKNTFEDPTLNGVKILHTGNQPHPVVHYYEAYMAPSEGKNPNMFKSRDDSNYVLMNKGVFDKTVMKMNKDPAVLGRLGNMSDVSNISAFAIPAEAKGDISLLLKQGDGLKGASNDTTSSTTSNVFSSGARRVTKATETHRARRPTGLEFNTTSTTFGKNQQTKSSGGKKNQFDIGNDQDDLEDLTGGERGQLGLTSANTDFSDRSWVNSSMQCGNDVKMPKQAFLKIMVESMPASKLKTLNTV
jgi:hypothetical protein